MRFTEPVVNFYKNVRYNDEPQLFQYTAISRGNVWGGGISFNRVKAKNKAIGESIERYCLEVYDEKDFVCAPIKKLKTNFLDPNSVVSVSNNQKKEKGFSNFIFAANSKFGWVSGRSLFDNKKTLIPAQLVYVPYSYGEREPYIRFPISTGAALGIDMYSALARGVFEVVERDSFMIFYLNKKSAPEVDPKNSSSRLMGIKQYFQRYKLDLRLFDITSDLNIPVFMTLLVDRTGKGPWISVGLKSGFNKEEVAIGSIEEAQHTRGWMRNERGLLTNKEYGKILNSKGWRLHEARDRGLFWYSGKYASKLDFWLKTDNPKTLVTNGAEDAVNGSEHDFKMIKEILEKRNIRAYYVDITRPEVFKLGLFVVKVIIPKLQPLYLDEEFPYLGGERLGETSLNRFPHPFL